MPNHPETQFSLYQQMLPHYRRPLFQALNEKKPFTLLLSQPEDTKSGKHCANQQLYLNQVNWGNFTWTFGLVRHYLHSKTPMILPLNPWLLSGWVISLLAKLKLGPPMIVWGHGYTKKEDSRLRRLLREAYQVGASAVILYSEHALAMGFKEHPKRPLTIANNTISDPADNLAYKKRSTESERILFVSRLFPENRVDLLLQSIASIATETPAHIDIVGEGPDLPRLKNLCHKLGISPAVTFHGAIYDQSKLVPLYLKAGIYCYPSNAGLSLITAAAFGLPLICGDDYRSHNPEILILRHGETGLTFIHNDPADLAKKLTQLLSSPRMAEALGAQARKEYETNYSVSAWVNSMSNCIDQVLHSHG